MWKTNFEVVYPFSTREPKKRKSSQNLVFPFFLTNEKTTIFSFLLISFQIGKQTIKMCLVAVWFTWGKKPCSHPQLLCVQNGDNIYPDPNGQYTDFIADVL